MSSTSPRPRRRFGQNFLVDGAAIGRIADALGPLDGEAVVEIGPGRGALTRALLDRGARVTAIEIDRDLAATLARELGPRGLALRVGDVLKMPWDDLAAVAGAAPGARVVLAGNLPYNVSKPIAMRVVAASSALSRAVLMFQREVAERLTAGPGGKDYGPLTVLAGETYRIETLFDLAPGAFRPRPKVHSTVTRWVPRDPPPSPAERDALARCLRACFARRRRTIANNVRAALGCGDGPAAALLGAAGIDPGVRPETVAREAFVRLAARWPGPHGT